MKAIQYATPGEVDVLQIIELAIPQPKADEVLVKVGAAGVNYADTLQRRGTYFIKVPLPYVGGYEVAGTIVTVGSNVTHLQPGQRVAAVVPSGGYAEYAIVPAAQAIPLPDDLGDAEATALLIQGMTALGLLRTGNYESILVLAATGGVGSMLVQIAKNLGKTVIAAVGSNAKKEQALGFGADAVVSYKDADWVDQVAKATDGRGVAAAFDAVGGELGAGALQTLGDGGTLVVYGSASGSPTMLAGQQLIGRMQAVRGYTLFAEQARFGEYIQELVGYVQAGKLKIAVQTYPFTEVQTAHRDMESRQTQGKVVLVL